MLPPSGGSANAAKALINPIVDRAPYCATQMPKTRAAASIDW